MDSRDKDQTTQHHPPHLSSLVVRPPASDGADGGGSGGRAAGNDYEPGEVKRDLPPYSRSNLYNESGYRIRAGSSSPLRHRDADHRYGLDFDRSGGSSRSREYDDRRDFGRYRDFSPPHSRRPGGGRPVVRGFDGPGLGPRPVRGEAMVRNNPNVRPREGDWICPDTLCGNLNFAWREYCNNCRRSRYAVARSPRRGYRDPPLPHVPSRRFPGPPLDLSPRGSVNTYRSPPRSWERDGPRDFGVGAMPPLRHEGRFSDHMHRDRLDHLEDEYRRSKFDRPMLTDWGHRNHGRDGYFNERKGYERHPPSPPPLAPGHAPFSSPRGRWTRDLRDRSRSPVRGLPPPRDYRRDMLMERGRDGRRVGRDRVGDAY